MHVWSHWKGHSPSIVSITCYFRLFFQKGFHIHISEEHGNWLTIGELIRSIRKPVSIYVDEIVEVFHKKLRTDLLSVGKCTNPADCNTKTDERKLCKSCKCWFKELKDSHEKGKNPSWHKNCNSSQWSEDPWEVAKYFMPALGSNHSTVKDAESTDLPSLLNVLEWMKGAAFLGKTRVNVDLVRKLRSQVRNTWAHAPQHELTDDEKTEGFSIAADFLKDLENVSPNSENSNCSKYLKHLMTKGVTGNVVECELQSLLLQRQMLDDLKEEITNMKLERSSDKTVTEEQLVNLKRALNEWSTKMCDFQRFRENIDKQFNKFSEELKSFRGIPDDIHEIRESLVQIRDAFAQMNKPQKVEPVTTSCLLDKLENFAGRKDEIQKVIDLLQDKQKAVVSIHGGPGFGKTAIAIQVSYRLSGEHNIPVVFSQLSAATNEDEMIRQLCLDVGVNYEDDPKSSLILWLKNIGEKIIWVMDDVDNLLEDRTSFYGFVRLLRKNSRQLCQIITTSRTSCEISELQTQTVPVDQMDDEASMELLKKRCPKKDDIFLRKLAELCGYVPLAMCIAGSLVDEYEDSDELLHHLEKQPMKTLKHANSDQYVNRAINLSYEKCSDEEQETFVRLSVFEESFNKDSAKVAIEKDTLDTADILQKLASRSLIKQPTKHRYSIHLLIKHFLNDKQKSGDEKAERALAAARRAEVLMVEYYLELGHQLTMKSYSKDGYKDNREALKRDASNIQNVLKICCQEKHATRSDISDCLARSKIYNTSAKFVSLFLRTIIPGSIVDEFLQRCINLAMERKQLAVKINFDCLLADQERSKTIGKSDKDFNLKTDEIKKEFETHYEELKEDTSLCAHYYYQYGRYLMRKAQGHTGEVRLDLLVQARECMERSLELRKALAGTPSEKADEVFSLLHLGNTWKMIATTEHWQKNSASEMSSTKAEKYYREAIKLSQDELGDHELTSSCHKSLGDLLFTTKKDKLPLAEKEYTIAKNMREKFGLDASERHVYLLNNLGQCLSESNRAKESNKVLESARDMAEKLAENDEPTVCKTKVYKSLAIANNSVYYAKKALEFDDDQIDARKILKGKVLGKIREIVDRNGSGKSDGQHKIT